MDACRNLFEKEVKEAHGVAYLTSYGIAQPLTLSKGSFRRKHGKRLAAGKPHLTQKPSPRGLIPERVKITWLNYTRVWESQTPILPHKVMQYKSKLLLCNTPEKSTTAHARHVAKVYVVQLQRQ